jgi:hypothetical protein
MAFGLTPLPQASQQMLHLLRTQIQFMNIFFWMDRAFCCTDIPHDE